MTLSVAELASRAGTSADIVRRLSDLGVLAPNPAEGPFDESIVPRVRVALQLEASGISLDDIGRAIAEKGFSLAFADALFGRPVGMLDVSSRGLQAQLNLSEGFMDDVRVALGASAGWDEPIREDDAELFGILDRFVHQGLDERVAEQVAIRFFYVVAEAARKIAAGGREMWRKGVEEPLFSRGLSSQEFLEAIAAPGPESQRLVDPMMTLLFHRFIEAEIVQEVMLHLETALDDAGVHRKRQASPPAIAFLDLTGYTKLTEEAGDEAAADHARSLVDLVRKTAMQHGGRLVKMLGDGAMFHFTDPLAAIRCGLELVEQAPAAGLPPARVGVNAGPLIQRDGDFFGRTVNVAARVADYARPNEVLATADAVRGISSGLEFLEIGGVSLRGVADPVELYAAKGAVRA